MNLSKKKKEFLALRSHIIQHVREFFWSQDFLEVDAPTIVKYPGQEPYLSPMKIAIHDEKGKEHQGFLHTSPEFPMKKMLAAGFERIFYLGQCFRDYESFGGWHQPEFTMLEWYRSEEDMWKLMDDVEQLFSFMEKRLEKSKVISHKSKVTHKNATWRRLSMKELWGETVGVDLDEYLTVEAMIGLCRERGCEVADDEVYENAFYKIFLNDIESKLAHMGNVIVYHYPAQMAALAKLSAEDPRYAERFEVYIDGMEIANAFSELTDADEQLRRFKEEQALRKTMGKEVHEIDMDFIDAVGQMPEAAGIALGVDRMVMALTGCQEIDDVVGFPMSSLFSDNHKSKI